MFYTVFPHSHIAKLYVCFCFAHLVPCIIIYFDFSEEDATTTTTTEAEAATAGILNKNKN